MTTKEEYRNYLRLRLNDSTSTRWSNVELDAYIAESVLRLSKLFPHLKETQVTIAVPSTRIDLPGDLVDQRVQKIWAVERPVAYEREVPPYQLRPRASKYWFEVVDDRLILGWTPLAGTILRIRYSSLHTLPPTGNSSVPSEDEDLVYLWAEHLAWRKIAGSDASLSRWRDEGKRDDGPIIPHYVMLERQYMRMVEEKKAGGRFLTLRRQEPRYRLPGWWGRGY